MSVLLVSACIAAVLSTFIPLADAGGFGAVITVLAIFLNAIVALEMHLRTKDSGEAPRLRKVHMIATGVLAVVCALSWLIEGQVLVKGASVLTLGWLAGQFTMVVCVIVIGAKFLIDKLARQNGSTQNEYAKWTEETELLKITKIASISSVAAVVLIVILTSVIGNSSGARVKAFDRLVTTIPTVQNKYDPNIENLQEDLDALGLTEETNCKIDEEFVTHYLKNHSGEALIDNLYTVYEYMCTGYGNVDEESSFYKMQDILEIATKAADIELKTIDFSKEDAEGFYTQRAEEYPKTKEWEESGRFYSSSGENAHTETRTCQSEMCYYGEFAVTHSTGYDYNKGRYEWVAGIFYDELPSWEPFDRYYLDCRGLSVLCIDSGADAFWTEAKALRYMEVGERLYVLYSSQDQAFAKAWDVYEIRK